MITDADRLNISKLYSVSSSAKVFEKFKKMLYDEQNQ